MFFHKSCRAGICCLAVLGFLTGCEDSPNSVGVEGFDRGGATGQILTDTLTVDDITNYVSYMDSISTGSSNRLYLGSVDDLDFRILFRFTIPSVLEEATVLGARLELVPSAVFGTSGSFDVRLHSIRRTWSSGDLRWNRFAAGVDYGDVIAQATLTGADAGGARFQIPVPTDTVQQWIKALNDTQFVNYGLLLDFDPAAGFAQQFYGATLLASDGLPDSNYVPRLAVTYQTFDKDSVVTINTQFLVPINLISYSGGSQGYVYRDRSPEPSNTLTIGGGVPYHSLLRFSMNRIPSTATISRAELIALRDPSGDYRYTPTDSVILQAGHLSVDPSEWAAGNTSILFALPTDNMHDDTFRVAITTSAQIWADDDGDNDGLVLFHGNQFLSTGDFSRLYRIRLRIDPLNPEPSPKIVVYYTLPPQIQN